MPEQDQGGQLPERNTPERLPHKSAVAISPPTPSIASPYKLSRRIVITGFATLGGVSVGGGILWWVITPHPFYVYRGHSGSVGAVAWSPNGKRIASGSDDHTVQVWNAIDGSSVSTYNLYFYKALSLSWSPDGKRIALGSDDHTVQVWDASDIGSHSASCLLARSPGVRSRMRGRGR